MFQAPTVSLLATFVVADSASVPLDTRLRLPWPKPFHPKTGRACLVCHPNREHLVPSPHPISRPRCRPKPAEGHRRTGHSPKTRTRSASFRPSTLRRRPLPVTRRCRFGTRYVQSIHRQAGFIFDRNLRAPSRALPLGAAVNLSVHVDVVDALGHTPAFVRAPGFPVCRSTPFRRDRHGVGCDATLHAHGADDTPNNLAAGTADSSPESKSRWSHPQQEQEDTFHGVHGLPTKSARVIVAPVYLTDTIHSQGFSPSQRFDPTLALQLCFTLHPPIGFSTFRAFPTQPAVAPLDALCSPVVTCFRLRVRRLPDFSRSPALASRPASPTSELCSD